MADEQLQLLRLQRGRVKGKLTRAKSYFEKLDISTINDLTVNQLQVRLESITPLLEEFSEIQDKIETPENVEEETKEREEFEDCYFEVVANFNKTIADYTNVQEIQDNNDSDSAKSSQSNTQSKRQSTQCQSSSRFQQVALPSIKLPTFKGNYADWLGFRDAFSSLVHNNRTISDVAKFYHLQSSLEGDAKQVIQSLEATDANYKIAWDLLVERYENKRLIIYNHVKAVFEQSVLVKESHIDLRFLYDNVTRHLRCLKMLDEPVQYWDTLLIHLITNKLDHNSRREWESYKIPSDLPTMDDLNQFLKQRCELLEKLHVTRTDTKDTKISRTVIILTNIRIKVKLLLMSVQTS